MPFYRLRQAAFLKSLDTTSHLRREISRTKEQLNSSNIRIKELLLKLRDTEERLDSSQKQLSSVQQTYTVKVSKLEEDLQKLNVVKPDLQREVVHLRIALNNANKSNKMASDRIQEISINNQKQAEEIQNWTARLYIAEKTMTSQQSRIEEQNTEINSARFKIDTQVQEINYLRSTVESQNQEIINLKDIIDDQDQEIQSLRETIDYHSAGHNGGNPYPVYHNFHGHCQCQQCSPFY